MGAIHSGRCRLGRMGLATVPEPAKTAVNRTTAVFGERVRNRRLELGLSQEAAAVRCGIHWTQLGKVERGQRSLRLETLIRIAEGLDVDAGLLVTGLPSPT
jgi:DNA-binding XRE family transcriptional regulator